ncbi:MAG: 50S ribosomal protein L6 [Akkermansiaceae bacterium]|jgi:large subunit ribosomal protein L6
MSRVGLKPIQAVDKITVKIGGNQVNVEGPKGKLSLDLPEGLTVEVGDGQITVVRASEQRHVRALHGTFRSLIYNLMVGVSEGFVKELEIQGVGFRAAVKGKALDLSLGKSHPILHPIPEGLTVTVTDNTKIKVEGIDKQLVGQFAAEVRNYYPPEPYKGKGVRYVGEYVRRKAGKSVK